MKKVVVVVLVLVLAMGILSSSAFAALRFKGGYFMPTETVGEGEEKFPDNGLIFGAEITTTLTGGILGLGLGVDYFSFSKTIGEWKGDLHLIPVSATLYFFPPNASLYLGAGGGYHMAYVEGNWEPGNAFASGIGYHGVIGYNITRNIFIEGKYSTCTVDGWKSGEVDVEAITISDIGGITIMIGLSI